MAGSRSRQHSALIIGSCAALVTAVFLVLASPAGALPPPPPNPSDEEIAASQNQAEVVNAQVGQLSAEVAATEGEIDRLRHEMELKVELSHKAAIDLEIAVADAEAAKAAAEAAAAEAASAQNFIDDAQRRADDFAAASYRQGSQLGSVSALIGSGSPAEMLQRDQLLDAISRSQLDVLGGLQRAQVAKFNLDAAARQALAIAEQKQAEADAAKQAADAAAAEAARAVEVGESQLVALEERLSEQRIAYQAAVNVIAQLQNQRQAYNQWLELKRAEEERLRREAEERARREAEERARREAEERARREAEAARAAAEQAAAAQRAAQQAEAQRQAARQAQQRQAQDTAQIQEPPARSIAHNGDIGATVIAAAKRWVGTQYAWGGGNANGPTRGIRDGGRADQFGDYNKVGFDCSGLTLYAYAQVGIALPHYSGYQYYKGARISRSNLQPGDLVFWAHNTSSPGTIHHVAIWLGNNQILEAPQSGSSVKISTMRWSGYIGASRPYA